MSEGLNKVLLMGALGADPELRFTQSGQAVLNIRLATNERYKDKSGEWKDKTEWHTVVVWGPRAEALGKILRKGAQVFVDGSLRTSSFEKNGEKRFKTEVNASNVVLCGGKGDAAAARPQGAPRFAPPAPTAAAYGQAPPSGVGAGATGQGQQAEYGGGAGYGGGGASDFGNPGANDDIPFASCAFDPHRSP